MRIGIISDTHGNLPGWERAMALGLGDADLIVHCGDVLYHGPKFDPVEGYSPRGLAAAINASATPVLIARGNADADVDQLVLEVPLQSPYVFARMEGLRILATHGHLQPLEDLVALARRWGIDLLLSGHLHVPSVEMYEGLMHVNPGTATYPLSQAEPLQRRTCALWEDGHVTHFDLEGGEALKL